jgi:murein DD-endopeptidase MepM/ murein hydrolase activator NlpD
MPKLSLPKEVKPYVVTQKWGVHRPDVYAQFGFDDHNGTDVMPGNRKEVRASVPYEVQRIIWQPNGGGLVMGIVSQGEYDAPDGKPANVQIHYLHLEKTLKKVGDRGAVGDVLAIADNTGFSTGPHTHLAHKWIRRKGSLFVDVETNGAQNTFDPEPYRDGSFAEDYATIRILTKLVSALQQLLLITQRQKP